MRLLNTYTTNPLPPTHILPFFIKPYIKRAKWPTFISHASLSMWRGAQDTWYFHKFSANISPNITNLWHVHEEISVIRYSRPIWWRMLLSSSLNRSNDRRHRSCCHSQRKTLDKLHYNLTCSHLISNWLSSLDSSIAKTEIWVGMEVKSSNLVGCFLMSFKQAWEYSYWLQNMIK